MADIEQCHDGILPAPFRDLLVASNALFPRLSAELDRPVFVKRDDLLGPALGGNKTRKLEYLLAEARQQGATKVVTFGGLQSNHARLTAAAASLLGLEAHLLYFEPRPKALTGNLLLNELLGARMHFFPLSPKRPRPRSIESTIRLARLLARLRVGPHYFIPVGGHTWTGRSGTCVPPSRSTSRREGSGSGQGGRRDGLSERARRYRPRDENNEQ